MSKLTKEDIDKQIASDYKKWYEQIYDGELPIGNLKEVFKTALMETPPGSHQYHFSVVKLTMARPSNELRWLDIGMMINLVFAIPLKYLDSDFDIAMDKMITLEAFRNSYNKAVDLRQKQLKSKGNKLMEIAGLGGNTVNLGVNTQPRQNMQLVK